MAHKIYISPQSHKLRLSQAVCRQAASPRQLDLVQAVPPNLRPHAQAQARHFRLRKPGNSFCIFLLPQHYCLILKYFDIHSSSIGFIINLLIIINGDLRGLLSVLFLILYIISCFGFNDIHGFLVELNAGPPENSRMRLIKKYLSNQGRSSPRQLLPLLRPKGRPSWLALKIGLNHQEVAGCFDFFLCHFLFFLLNFLFLSLIHREAHRALTALKQYCQP